MSKLLSLRARAALHYFVNSPMSISADRLAEVVAENRKAIQAALRELRDAELIITRKERTPRGVATVSYVTEKGFLEANSWGSQNVLQIQHTVQNSTIQVLAYSASNINKVTIDERLDEKVGYEFFEGASTSDADERESERLKAETRRKQEYQEAKAAEHAKKQAVIEGRTPEAFTVKQSLFEFADRMSSAWNIAPWSMSGSRFFEAYGFNRKKYETNGRIEQVMMDMFFDSLTDKEIDGNKVWKLFIARYSELSAQAKIRLNSPDDMATAMVQAEEQWKKEFGEDFSV
jgi:hypothetical protein